MAASSRAPAATSTPSSSAPRPAVERRVGDRQAGTWAVAVDADETLISNSEQSKLAALGAPGPQERPLPTSAKVHTSE